MLSAREMGLRDVEQAAKHTNDNKIEDGHQLYAAVGVESVIM